MIKITPGTVTICALMPDQFLSNCQLSLKVRFIYNHKTPVKMKIIMRYMKGTSCWNVVMTKISLVPLEDDKVSIHTPRQFLQLIREVHVSIPFFSD